MTRRRRFGTAALSLAGHAVVIALIISARGEAPREVAAESEVIPVMLAPTPPPPPPQVEAPKTPKPEKATRPPPPRRLAARPVRAPPTVPAIPAGKVSVTEGTDEVSESELASAGTADSGGGGGCNMTRRLQAALRKDPLIQSTIAAAHRGKAIRVWNRDWIRHGEEEGAGLAAVREAILWEVGFAPAACRAEAVRGPIVISLNDAPGAPRLVLGSGDWRWSDLLRRGSSLPAGG